MPAAPIAAPREHDLVQLQRGAYDLCATYCVAIVGTYRALRKTHIVRYLAGFEWRFNNRFDRAAMILTLGRAAGATKPQPDWWLKMADYGA